LDQVASTLSFKNLDAADKATAARNEWNWATYTRWNFEKWQKNYLKVCLKKT